MRRFLAGLVFLAGSGAIAMAHADIRPEEARTGTPPDAAPFSVAATSDARPTAAPLGARFAAVSDRLASTTAPTAESSGPDRSPIGLGADRARILLRSLTLPGWGQATLGRRTSAKVFLLTEAGVWGSFLSFRVQEAMRRQSYESTARIFAGIDLDGRDEEFRRIVGVYPSSDDYNLYVVRRDAANLFYDKPQEYDEYIAKHELKGANAWAWQGPESFRQYGEQRKFTRKAALRANAMLGLAIANRLVSALHAARSAGAAPAATHSWNLEIGPRPGDPGLMAVGMQVRF